MHVFIQVLIHARESMFVWYVEMYYYVLDFPADIGIKPASPARGSRQRLHESRQRLHAGESRQHLHAG